MPIDFPNNPVNNQVYPLSGSRRWTYNASISAWQGGTDSFGGKNYTQSDTPPPSPQNGDLWLNTLTMQKYDYYDGFWIETAGAAVTVDSVQTALSSGNYYFGGSIKVENGYSIGPTAVVSDGNTAITIADTHNGKILNTTSNSAVSATIPNNLVSGFNCMVIQKGSGQVTFLAGAGTTLNSYLSARKIAGQHASASIIWQASGEYNISGNLA